MERNITIFTTGLVTIGVITALLLPGRNFGTVAGKVGSAVQNLQYTAITGQK